MVRGWLVRVVLVTVCAASLVAIAAAPAAGGQTRRTAALNRQAAVRDAAGLLGRLALPPGAAPASHEPAGDGGALAQPAMREATPDLVDRHAWWRVAGSPTAVLSYIEAHPPARGKVSVTGSAGGGGTPHSALVGFDWPAVAGVLSTRWLLVQVVRLTGGSTGVRADAEVVWIIPRPAREKVPAGVHVVDITRSQPGHAPSLSLSVTDGANVGKIVSMIDRLPTVQPGVSACPGEAVGTPMITFTFRAIPGGPALASASELADASAPSTPCDPLTFSIGGVAQTALLGGAGFLRRTERLLGVNLAGTAVS